MRSFLVSIMLLFALTATAQTTINPTQVRGTAIVQTPSGGVGVRQSVGNLAQHLNEEMFPGTTIDVRVNNAVASCGSTVPCVIVLPPYAPLGVGWTLPLPNNVLMEDQRGYNTQGFAGGQAPYLRSYSQYHMYRGAEYPFENNELGAGTFTMDIESSAYDGGYVDDGGKDNAGSLLVYSERTAGSRPIWGQDNNIQCSNLNNYCTGIEINMVNQGGGSDAGKFRGLLMTASGADATNDAVGSGLTIQGSHGHWLNAATIQTYSGTGIRMIPGMARVADMSFIPPADDANPELLGRNAANSTNVWSIDDTGNIRAASLVAQIVNASAGGTIAPATFGSAPSAGGIGLLWNLTGGTGETDFVNNHGVSGGGGYNWYNTGTTTPGTPIMVLDSTGKLSVTGIFSSGGTNGFTGSCASTTTITVKGGIITGCS